MKSNLSSNASKTAEELQRLQQEAEAERKRLEQELLKAAEEYLLKIQTMEVAHEEKVTKLAQQKDADKEVGLLGLIKLFKNAIIHKSEY